MEKSIKSWLEEIPDLEVREKALRNHANEKSTYYTKDFHDRYNSLHEAVGNAFEWENTPEGLNYWDNLHAGLFIKSVSANVPQDPEPTSEHLRGEVERLTKELNDEKIRSGNLIVDLASLQTELDKARADKSAEWVPVSTPLEIIKFHPDEHIGILLTDGEFVYYGEYEDGDWVDSNGDSFGDDGVIITHWQPLPEPPEVK